ncbi:MAG: YlxR family protein [Candidatus Nanopelagicales bacterium]
MRTCVGCRRPAAKSQLLRVVCVDGVLTADPMARLEGRGAYLHHDLECLNKAESRHAFQRALRIVQAATGFEELRLSMATTHTRERDGMNTQ